MCVCLSHAQLKTDILSPYRLTFHILQAELPAEMWPKQHAAKSTKNSTYSTTKQHRRQVHTYMYTHTCIYMYVRMYVPPLSDFKECIKDTHTQWITHIAKIHVEHLNLVNWDDFFNHSSVPKGRKKTENKKVIIVSLPFLFIIMVFATSWLGQQWKQSVRTHSFRAEN